MIRRLLLILFVVFSTNFYAEGKSNLKEGSLLISNSGGVPVLSNFRVENSHKDRVYFDSNIAITGASIKGFIVDGKKVSAIKINSSNKTGHYIKVSSAFSFWDNNTIRYEGGSNIKSNSGVSLNKFTLQHIVNKISEPKAELNVYYVSTKGNDKNNGRSQSKAFRTIKKAVKIAKAGSTIWVKAGNYGNEKVEFVNSGTEKMPIKVLGYKNKPGDIKSMYYKYGKSKLNSNEMPLLDGKDRSQNTAFAFPRTKYILVKNIQLTNYKNGFYGNLNEALIFDNCLGVNFGSLRQLGRIFAIGTKSKRVRITNSIAVNSTMHNILYGGSYGYLANNKSYGNDKRNAAWATDYWFIIVGSHNIAKNNYALRDGNIPHSGHGFSMGADGAKSDIKYNLIEDFEAVNFAKSLELRHYRATHNVIRNHEAWGQKGIDAANGLQIREGASNNVIENAYIHDVYYGTTYADTREKGYGSGSNNKFVNCVFENFISLVGVSKADQKPNFSNNDFINCTAYNGRELWRKDSKTQIKNNKFINCNFVNVKKQSQNSGVSFQNSNFYNSFKKTGNGNISVNPNFENAKSSNFKLKSNSKLIDKGVLVKGVNYLDFDGNVRSKDKVDIGAYEYVDNSIGYITPVNAGDDVSICKGDKATLTAKGGTKFKWSNGATTKSITVSPDKTTTYTVDNGSSTDNVKVTVNELPNFDLGADKTITSGDKVTLKASGGKSYKWSTGATTSSITVNPSVTKTYSVVVTNASGCTLEDSIKIIVNQKASVVANAGDDVSICDGDQVKLTASGGDTYKWSTGATTQSITVSPSKTTEYTVTVRKNNVSDSDNVKVIVNELPKFDLGSDKTITSGDEVTLKASGGKSYKWSTGATTSSIRVSPSVTKTYSVVVTNASGCTSEDSIKVTVNQKASVVANAGDDVSICDGDQVKLTASGGDTYKWSTGATTQSITVSPSKTTEYTVTVRKDNVSDSDKVKVTVNELPDAYLGRDKTINKGENVTLKAPKAVSYRWSTGETTQSITISPQETENFTVKITNASGCSAEDTIKVIVTSKVVNSDEPSAGEDITICKGAEAELVATGGDSYIWSTGDTTKTIKVKPSETTIYSVKVKKGTNTTTVHVIVYIDYECDINDKSEILIYPNPTNAVVNVTLKGFEDTLLVYLLSMRGNILHYEVIRSDSFNDLSKIDRKFDLSAYSKGVYFVRVQTNESIKTKKVILK